MPNVVDSFGQKMPSTPPVPASGRREQALARRERALGRRAAVLVVAHDLDARVLLHASRKPFSRLCVLAEPSW